MTARPRFTAVTMMKDEGPFLLEWLAFHRIAGFDTVLVFHNDCTDGTDAMLERLQAMGLCTALRNVVPPGKRPQPHALTLAEKRPEVTQADWAIVLDADEFVAVSAGAGTVQDLAAALPEGAEAAALVWRCHGSNGIESWAPHLVIESYPMAAPDDFAKGLGVKTLFRPFDRMKLGIHRPHAKGKTPLAGRFWVDGSGRPLDAAFVEKGWRLTPATAGRDLAEIAHYAVKSREAFLLRRWRGNVNLKPDKYDSNYFGMFDRNEVPDPVPARHLPALRALLAEWRRDAELARLEALSLAEHARRIDLIRAAPDYPAQMQALRRMGAVPYHRLQNILYIHDFPLPFRTWVRDHLARGVPEAEMLQVIRRIVADHDARKAAGAPPAQGGNGDETV